MVCLERLSDHNPVQPLYLQLFSREMLFTTYYTTDNLTKQHVSMKSSDQQPKSGPNDKHQRIDQILTVMIRHDCETKVHPFSTSNTT